MVAGAELVGVCVATGAGLVEVCVATGVCIPFGGIITGASSVNMNTPPWGIST